MTESIGDVVKRNKFAKILAAFFVILTLWWVSINARELRDSTENNAFTLIYPLISLFGGVVGVGIARKWGGFKSYFGSSVMLFALGLLAQFFGQASYAWLIYIKGVEIPYPSIGDLGYYGSVWFYILGALKLSKVVNPDGRSALQLKKVSLMLGVPLAMLLFSYWVFLKDYEFLDTPAMTVFLDFAYPLSQAIYVALAISIYLGSRKILGGLMRSPTILLLSALVIQYFSDFMFLYQSKAGTWYVGGLNDYLYFVSYCAMMLALIRVGYSYDHISSNKSE